MSAAPLRQQRPSPRAGAPRPKPSQASPRHEHLRAVAAPDQVRSMVPFAWVCVTIVLGSMAAVLLLNTTMASGAYERRDLKIEIADLHQERSTLVTQLESNSSPQFLATAASEMGMVPAKTLGFISLKSAVVLESKGQ